MLLWFALAAGGLVIVGAVVWSRFAAELRMHRGRVSRGSQVVPSRFGQIEFATMGHGAPVLIVHGAGGGFDQGLSAARRLTDAGYKIIAPSRFGYLRSSSPDDPSPEHQADAFVDLLDSLQIQRIPVVGMSAGALSALQFAVRHPDRCRSLTVIVPAAAAVMRAQGPLPEQGPLAKAIFEYVTKSDVLWWLGMKLAPTRMIRFVLATDPAVVAAANPAERKRALDTLGNILPLSARSQGFRNDACFVSTPQAIAVEKITAPTLVASLEDDFYGTLAPARAIAAAIPGARLLTYATGGHAFIGREADLFAEVEAFISQYQPTETIAAR